MCRFTLVFTLLLCALVSAPTSAAPSANPEPIDDLTLRLLDNDLVRTELAMDRTQASMLDIFGAEYAKQRRVLVQKRAAAKPADQEQLDKQLKELQATLRRDTARILTPPQLVRLGQVKVQALGARAAFGNELRTALAITPEQNKKFLDALIRYEDALYAEFRRLAGEKNEEAARGRLMAVHQQERRELDRTVCADILDPAQCRRLAEVQGPAAGFAVDAVRPDTLLGNLKQRASRPVPRYRQPYPLSVLVRLPEVRDLLRATPGENERLTRCADEWDKAQDDIHASLHYLNPRAQEKLMWEWRQSYAAAVPGFEAKLGDILGPDRLTRLKEIRRQVCGPQMLLQVELLTGQELSAPQKERFEKTRQQLAADLQKRISSTLQASRTGTDLAPLYDAHIRATDQAVLTTLTPTQRAAWQTLTGESMGESMRRALRKGSAEIIGGYAVRRG